MTGLDIMIPTLMLCRNLKVLELRPFNFTGKDAVMKHQQLVVRRATFILRLPRS